jgi:anaerobic magnesium-protoporphyrin IX monomethyl ester cyclase
MQTVLFLIPPLKSILGNPHVRKDGRDSYRARYPAIGIGYIIALLKQARVTCKVLDMNIGYSSDDVLAFVKSNKPDFVGIMIFSAGYQMAYSLIDYLRPHYEGKVVVGGPHVSVVTKQILEETTADFAIVGEGEHALLELVQNSELKAIKGLIWRQESKIIVNETRPYLEDIDSLPFPAFEDFELEKYFCYVDRRVPIITSRGCPYQCNYCCTRLSMGKKWRARSPENVVDEIQYWYEKGWSIFDINDDVFTLDKDRAEKICNLILERKLNIILNLYVGIRVDNIDEHLLRVLKKSGCRFISYGCEAGNNRILKDIKKGIKVEDVINAVEITREVGINCKVNFIVGHPSERYEDFMDSIKLAQDLRCSFIGFNNLIPYPGTEAYSDIESDPNARFLYSPEVYLNELTHKRLTPVFETNRFTSQERAIALKRAFDVEERTLARFRFGKLKGTFVYVLGRNKHVSAVSRWLFDLAISTRLGSATYRLVVKPPW